jgi:isopenicillin N synthase-like dioxygenase
VTRGNLDTAPVADASLGAIPLIDLSRANAGACVAEACAEWGFFQVVGHDVAPELMASAEAQARAFFALPKVDKRALSRSRDNPWGFYDRELTKNARDKKEIFDIGPNVAVRGHGEDPFSGATPWPKRPAGFEAVMRDYFEACEGVSARLLEMIGAGLGAPAGTLGACFAPAHTSFLRLNFYPVSDPLAGETSESADLGIHHHTDAGALTVLMQDEVSGLQVYRDGYWYDVAPLKGAFVINIGDMAQVWSNDLYRAPVHRVLAMDRIDRLSLPFFYNPAYGADVAPLQNLVWGARSPRYRPIPWGEFRRRRADGDFANYGAEVQISDYRIG